MPNSYQTLRNSISREVVCKSDQNVFFLHPFSYSHSEVLPVKSQFPHALHIRLGACDANVMQADASRDFNPASPHVCGGALLLHLGAQHPQVNKPSQPGGADSSHPPGTAAGPPGCVATIYPRLTLDTPPTQEKSQELPHLNPLTTESQARDLVV